MDIASRHVNSLVSHLTLGDCDDIRKIYGVVARFSATRRPGTYLVDTFPELANFPMYDWFSSWRKDGAEIHRLDAEIYRDYWNQMKTEVENNTAAHSWGKGFVQSDYQKHGIDELGAIYAAYSPCPVNTKDSGTMIEAGSETTSQALNNIIIGLLSNPDAVKKAQAELDKVIGPDRTPTFDDEQDLPYIRAIIKVSLFPFYLTGVGSSSMAPIQQVWTQSLCN
jgi:hypothetical protein